jgi:cell division protein FtsW
MTTATMSYGMRARERMPFAWDYVTLGLVAGLLLIGMIMVTSASMSIAARDLGNPFYFLERQFVFGFAGLLFAWVVHAGADGTVGQVQPRAAVPRAAAAVAGADSGHRRHRQRRAPLVASGADQFSGVGTCQGAGADLGVQLLRAQAHRARNHAARPRQAGGPVGRRRGAVAGEPDFGATTVLFATGFAVLFVAGARLRYVLLLVSAATLAFAVLALTSAYRLKRLTGFLHPWDDPFNGGFQLTQSLIAIGRGSWFGVGLGSSVQKLFYLPEAHTDFVFAVLAEELGLVGVLGVIALFMALVWRAFQISRMAAQAGLRFQSYLALAFGVWLGLQAMVNIGVNMGVLPTKGLTLPLLSYGRSSLLVSLAGWGWCCGFITK